MADNVLATLFQDQADAIREGLGEDIGKIKPVDFPARTREIVALIGGGSSEDVRYVTFMSHDGTAECGKKAVAVGDDCADPIARGIFDTPTRESTVQYDYTFAGWATESGGSASASALSSVSEDRAVYAAYTSAVRYYTISYYDGETLLTTQQVAYGSTPSYSPTKDGYNFTGWEPEVVAVTGDASYYAQWEEKAILGTAILGKMKL